MRSLYVISFLINTISEYNGKNRSRICMGLFFFNINIDEILKGKK